MNLRDIFLAGAFAQGGGGAVSPEQITEAVNSYLNKNPVGVDLAMTGAAVGQIAKITAVDASGVPIAWEPVDLPSGGGGSAKWKLWERVTLTERVQSVEFDFPDSYSELLVILDATNERVYTDIEGNALTKAQYINIAICDREVAAARLEVPLGVAEQWNGVFSHIQVMGDYCCSYSGYFGGNSYSNKPFTRCTEIKGTPIFRVTLDENAGDAYFGLGLKFSVYYK